MKNTQTFLNSPNKSLVSVEGMIYQRDSNGYQNIFEPDSIMSVPTLPNIIRLPEFKMADYKPEVHCISGTELRHADRSHVTR